MEPLAGERSQGIRRPRRPVGVAVAVVVLLALVALASRGHKPGAGGGSTRHVNGDLILEYVVLFMLAAGVVVIPLVAQAFWTRRHWYARRRQAQNWPKRMFGSLLIVTALLAGFYIWRVVTNGGSNSGRSRPRIGLPPQFGGSQDSGTAGPQFDWLPVVVVGSLLLAGAALVAVAILRERRELRRSPQTLAEQLSDVLDDTLDDLRAEPDARRAVIAAYARMERALAWFGLPRKAFEAPLEYLRRVLVDLHASAESVRRLTALFERAKFSPHEIGPRLKTDAIDALVAVRDELRAFR
jgi:hypothetical protein